MTISKKGYIFMILLLGIAFSGMGIILAHSQTEYAGIGQVGIHGVKNTRSLHVPGEIYFNSNNNNFSNYMILTHNETNQRIQEFPDTSGRLMVFSNEATQPICQDSIQGSIWYNPSNNNAYICIETDWWILHTIHAP